jgi:hypothetical protein
VRCDEGVEQGRERRSRLSSSSSGGGRREIRRSLLLFQNLGQDVDGPPPLDLDDPGRGDDDEARRRQGEVVGG